MLERHPIPVRSHLIRQVAQANWWAVPWVALQVVLIATMACLIDWRQVSESPLFSCVAVAVIVGPQGMSILRYYAMQKKEIGDLRETTRFGEFDKYRLRSLVDDTLNLLRLPLPGPPVFITADKSLNAGAMHLGLGGFMRALNGVYLNRQLLHRLTAAEVQDIIGHELGHFYRYYLVTQRFQAVTLVLGAISGVLVTQWIGMSDMVSMVALSICGSAGWFVSNKLYAAYAESIEFLCDDFGAQVHGVNVSINGLLKLGADSELQYAIHHQEIVSQKYANLTAQDIADAINAATPYGHTSRADLERAVEASLKRRSQERRQLSLAAFFQYAWQGDGDGDAVEELAQEFRTLQRVPRLNWESLLEQPGHIALNNEAIERLVELLETQPQQTLFRLPEEVGKGDGVHPPLTLTHPVLVEESPRDRRGTLRVVRPASATQLLTARKTGSTFAVISHGNVDSTKRYGACFLPRRCERDNRSLVGGLRIHVQNHRTDNASVSPPVTAR